MASRCLGVPCLAAPAVDASLQRPQPVVQIDLRLLRSSSSTEKSWARKSPASSVTAEPASPRAVTLPLSAGRRPVRATSGAGSGEPPLPARGGPTSRSSNRAVPSRLRSRRPRTRGWARASRTDRSSRIAGPGRGADAYRGDRQQRRRRCRGVRRNRYPAVRRVHGRWRTYRGAPAARARPDPGPRCPR